ncbi:hypothetical protein F4859DRAFT_298550 [Xylaria cf. heliscus]|nr:hypothetical protein F4859DRAFT_298550 [Xylaria cf. heliscus]
MMENIDSSDKKRTAQIFLMMTMDESLWDSPSFKRCVYTQAVLDALEANPILSGSLISGERGPILSPHQCPAKCHTTSAQIVARCKGPIEITTYRKVFPTCHGLQFVHRTVGDFLKHPDIQEKLIIQSGNFCPYTALIRSLLSCVKFIPYIRPSCPQSLDGLTHSSAISTNRMSMDNVLLPFLETTAIAESYGLPSFVEEIDSVIRMYQQISDASMEPRPRFPTPVYFHKNSIGTIAWSYKPSYIERIEPLIICIGIALGNKTFRLERIIRDPSLLRSATHGSHDMLLSCELGKSHL